MKGGCVHVVEVDTTCVGAMVDEGSCDGEVESDHQLAEGLSVAANEHGQAVGAVGGGGDAAHWVDGTDGDLTVVDQVSRPEITTAYNAALQSGTIAIACFGYRVSARAGHHKITFEAAALALGPEAVSLADHLDACRRRRNVIDSINSSVATETEEVCLDEVERIEI